MTIRASAPTCTSSPGALISIWNEARPSPFGGGLSFGVAEGAAGRGATGASGSAAAGALPRFGARSTAAGGASPLSRPALSSSISAGRDTPTLVSDILVLDELVPDEPVCALGPTRTAGAP